MEYLMGFNIAVVAVIAALGIRSSICHYCECSRREED